MKVVDIDLGKVEFSEALSYKIVFNDEYETEASPSSTEPSFQNNKFQYVVKNPKEVKEPLKVTIVGISNGEESFRSTEHFDMNYGKEPVPKVIEFSKSRGSKVEGVVNITYKLYKQTLTETLKNNDGIHCLSINAAFLNTLLDHPFDLKIRIKDLSGTSVGSCRLNNRSPAAYADIDRSCLDQPIELVVNDGALFFSIIVRPGQPIVTSLPLTSGDAIVLTTQLITGNNSVTGVCHSSALREGLVSVTSTGKRISLSPRRASTLEAGAAGAAAAAPGVKKTLLYMESASHANATTLDAVLSGINQAVIVSSAESNKPVNPSRVSATPTGPKSGAYITCGSKSEVLLDGDSAAMKKNRKQKKALHSINLGLLPCAVGSLTAPVKFHATLVDYLKHHFSPSMESVKLLTAGAATSSSSAVDANANPEVTPGAAGISPRGGSVLQPRVSPREVVFEKPTASFTGTLEESSREVFNESGLIAIVLEGKLFQIKHTDDSAVSDSFDAAAGKEETCMVLKVYLSLIPSSSSVSDPSPVAASSAQEEGEGRPEVPLLDVGAIAEESDDGADGEVAHLGDGNINKNVVEKGEPFNVVTSDSAQPDELRGSSVLTVPVEPSATASGSAAHSKAHTPVASEVEQLLDPKPSSAPFLAPSTGAAPVDGAGDHYGELSVSTDGNAFGEHLDPKNVQKMMKVSNDQRNQVIASNLAFAEIVRGELVEKQKLIETLLDDLKVRNEAIQVCGKDIRELRQEKANLLAKLQSVEDQLDQRNKRDAETDAMTEKVLKSGTALKDMDAATLVSILNQMREQLNTSEKEKIELQQVLRSAKTAVDQFTVMKKDYRELQDAHVVQTKQLQKMQKKYAQLEAYKSTIMTQEKVIAKLQSVIEAKIKKSNNVPERAMIPKPPATSVSGTPRSGRDVSESEGVGAGEEEFLALQAQAERDERDREREALLAGLRNDNAVLEKDLNETREANQTLEERVKELEQQLEAAKLAKYESDSEEEDEEEDEADLLAREEEALDEESVEAKHKAEMKEAQRKIDQLDAELVSKGFRITALEKQLETSTRDYSREIARLRTKLFELEISASMAGMGEGVTDELDMAGLLEGMSGMGSVANSRPTTAPTLAATAAATAAAVTDEKPNTARSLRNTLLEEESETPPPVIAATAVGADKPVVAASAAPDANKPEVTVEPAGERVSSKPGTPAAPSVETPTEAPNAADPMEKASVNKAVTTTIDITDANPGGDGEKCAKVTFDLLYEYATESKTYSYTFNNIRLHDFQQSEMKTRFHPFVELKCEAVGWKAKTAVEDDAGPVVNWTLPEDMKKLVVTDVSHTGARLSCMIKKSNAKSGQEDVLIGQGELQLASIV